ncbi:hypothetical protein KUTeg_002209 [Tegillarca granosa]|uniref:SH3 domain-containing protein n=1 Tax=Tegillarca granosa TaxID=220873 RepID=A0ABQ9FX94_TEGGR|nr:hypothetical protein KUTeg_002209 [Tegillarca granosa]
MELYIFCLSSPARGEITIVIEDYSAATNSELTVQKGQHVEIIDPAPGEPNWCMVRAISSEEGEPCQGLVPMAALKPLPTTRRPGSRSSMDLEEAFGADTSPSSSMASLNSSSPVAKRRSSFRKWLTTPVRKLSQTKIEKPGLEKPAIPSVLDADRVPVYLRKLDD